MQQFEHPAVAYFTLEIPNGGRPEHTESMRKQFAR